MKLLERLRKRSGKKQTKKSSELKKYSVIKPGIVRIMLET